MVIGLAYKNPMFAESSRFLAGPYFHYWHLKVVIGLRGKGVGMPVVGCVGYTFA